MKMLNDVSIHTYCMYVCNVFVIFTVKTPKREELVATVRMSR